MSVVSARSVAAVRPFRIASLGKPWVTNLASVALGLNIQFLTRTESGHVAGLRNSVSYLESIQILKPPLAGRLN